jgi:hypothetical protein
MKPIPNNLYCLKEQLETGCSYSFHLASAYETLQINGYEHEARELRECNRDRDDLLKAVNKIIKEMPLSVMVGQNTNGCLCMLLALGLAGLLTILINIY